MKRLLNEGVIRWGVILPKQLVEKKRLQENDRVLIKLVKAGDLSDIFFPLPRKMSGQAFKDMVRKQWN